jgi:hypothetical protein
MNGGLRTDNRPTLYPGGKSIDFKPTPQRAMNVLKEVKKGGGWVAEGM